MNSINEAIAKAKEQANVIAATQQASVPATRPGTKLTMDDLDTNSIDVEAWIQVDKHGLTINKSADLKDHLLAEIDVREIVPCYMVRYGKTPPQYRKTYDGVLTFGSAKPWEVTIQEARNADGECKGQYSSVEIPMTLIEKVDCPKAKKVYEAGTRVGYTTSITGYKNFQRFYKDLQDKGLSDGTVKVKIATEMRKGGGNDYGVMTFELLGN